MQEFNDHFSNSQLQQRARLELDKCKMCFPDVDQYISDFEDLVQQASYTIGNEETIGFFLNGLTQVQGQGHQNHEGQTNDRAHLSQARSPKPKVF